ncbi:LPS O-antigen chain length determinant protein WzzB [Pseudomonas sp. 1121_17]|uniref:LPS O-antigen chain length determinant protein WzzB n=1 Tax=Pseudomonas sp. 1121_17 TaxID=2604458 RepID=UPI004064121B
MHSERERLRSAGEIDLFELMEGVWRYRLLVVATALVVTGLAVTYAYLVTPLYESKVFVQPPRQNDIAQLNYGRGERSGLPVYTVKEVYGVYLRNLQSEALRRDFFREFYLPSVPAEQRAGLQDALYRRFHEVLVQGPVSKESPDRFFVMTTLPDPQQAVDWSLRYLEMAGQRATREIIKDAQSDILMMANDLDQQIAMARESARKQREDRIAQLTEALTIARAVNIEKPPIISNSLSAEVSAGMDDSLTYMRGSKALEAEIKTLRSRTSDDAFIVNLRQRQEQLLLLRKFDIDPSAVQVYRQDGAVESPDLPIKPKKLLIIVFGLMLGVVLGFVFATLASVRDNLRRHRKEAVVEVRG